VHVSWELCDRCWREQERVCRNAPICLRVVIGKLPADDEYMPGGPDAQHVDLCMDCLIPVTLETLGLEFEVKRAEVGGGTMGDCFRWLQEYLDGLTDEQRREWFYDQTGAWPYWTGREE
jgi:hypothetical protein